MRQITNDESHHIKLLAKQTGRGFGGPPSTECQCHTMARPNMHTMNEKTTLTFCNSHLVAMLYFYSLNTIVFEKFN